jgi:chemotaxis methyl-accepting protein methylase/HPt (histidine-containing phosphotransfer) domain-containing protein
MLYTKDIVNQFVTESKRYLETIEDDLYDLEKHKRNLDPQLVDKIFRVHHTIKEGAAFLGLKNINDLALIMENMFAMIRSGRIKPEPVIVDALQQGADSLNILLDDVDHSNETDISAVYKQLSELQCGKISEKVKKELDTNVALFELSGEKTGFEINQFTLKNLVVRKRGLYVLKFDLTELSTRENNPPLQLIRHLLIKGNIIEGRLKAVLEDLHAGLPRQPLIYEVLYATTLGHRKLPETVGLPEGSIIPVKMPEQATNFTAGYPPFEVFRDFVLPDLADRVRDRDARHKGDKTPIRIWSVGTPTGLELYLLSILVLEYITTRSHEVSAADFSIIATDAAAEALAGAIIGKYSDGELDHELLAEKKSEYFKRSGTSWFIRDHVRSMIDFRQVDLTQPHPFPGKVDVIFCHNVFKHFDSKTKKKMAGRFHRVLAEKGFLLPGEDCRLTGIKGKFEQVEYGETIVYKKNNGPGNTKAGREDKERK